MGHMGTAVEIHSAAGACNPLSSTRSRRRAPRRCDLASQIREWLCFCETGLHRCSDRWPKRRRSSFRRRAGEVRSADAPAKFVPPTRPHRSLIRSPPCTFTTPSAWRCEVLPPLWETGPDSRESIKGAELIALIKLEVPPSNGHIETRPPELTWEHIMNIPE